MIFAKEPYILHLLAGSGTMTALDAAKNLLDSGTHNAREIEPNENLSPLHFAAAWDNLAMCHLLIHYGADVDAQDIDKRSPMDVAEGECKRFLKKLQKKRRRERNKFRRVLAYFFGNKCTHQSSTIMTEELKAQQRKSCPAEIQFKTDLPRHRLQIIQREEPDLKRLIPIARTPLRPSPYPTIMSSATSSGHNPRAIPSAPRCRSSSIAHDEFLTSDNTGDGDELAVFVEMPVNSEDEAEQRKIHEQEEALRQQFSQLKLVDLKERLKRKKCPIGPLDARNRRIYEAKLAKLESTESDKRQPNLDTISRYSPALQKMVLNEQKLETKSNSKIGIQQEMQIRNEFLPSSAKKEEVSFFCYLLIDPTRLPPDITTVTFRRFLSTIFYIGKGKRSRPLQHLIHANKCRVFATNNPVERSDKLNRILDLWDRGEGVISLHVFHNVHSAEAFTREGAMIDAIGVNNLTNIQRGTFSGIAAKWTREQITEFGALLLQKAHIIFKNERCRPIFETDLKGM